MGPPHKILHHSLSGHPELAQLLGGLTAEWAKLEMMLSALLEAVTGMRMGVAIAIMHTLNSNKIQRDIIINCTHATLESENSIDRVERLMKRVSKAATKRNNLAHSVFALEVDDDDVVTGAIRMKIKPTSSTVDFQKVTTDDLESFIAEIHDINYSIIQAAADLRKPLRSSPDKS